LPLNYRHIVCIGFFNENLQIQDIFFGISYKMIPDSDASISYFVFESTAKTEDKT